MQQYLNLLQDIMSNGYDTDDRTGTGTRSVFGRQLRFDMKDGFPLVTTKKLYTRAIIEELLFFISGDTNVKTLQEKDVRIWNEWRRPLETYRPHQLVRVIKKPYQTRVPTFETPIKGDLADKLYKIWAAMISRCYSEQKSSYKNVSVCHRWQNFNNFYWDVQNLPNWWYKKKSWNDLELDKDYYGSNQYSPETCVWLPREENKTYREDIKAILITNPQGEIWTCLSAVEAARVVGVAKTTVWNWLDKGVLEGLKGQNKKFNYWSFDRYECPKDFVIRKELLSEGELGPIYGKQWRDYDGVDQLANVIEGLRTNPTGRRHIISAWNVSQIEDMALPPCHCLMQFKVYGDTLHLQLYQRSADVFLGVPFNIASYALLLGMVAQVTGLKAGEFVHTFGDVHIYNNHKEQVLTQLERKPYMLPTLLLNPEIKEIDDFTFDDIEIRGYTSWPSIKGEVSV